jgi:hypothetical protein
MEREKLLRNDQDVDTAGFAVSKRTTEADRDERDDGAALRASNTWQRLDSNSEASQQRSDDDDVIKVDATDVLTPNERSAGILGRMTQAQVRAARAELRAKKFSPTIEREFHVFCAAYGLDDSPSARQQFVRFLSQAGLGATKKPSSTSQSSSAAKAVFFEQVKSGNQATMDLVGARDVFDPRVALSDEEREQLRGLTMADGRNALEVRQEAEKAWETKEYGTVIDAKAAYASGAPHLAAFQMAARNAGYTSEEIAMVAESKSETWLWHHAATGITSVRSQYEAMPSSYDDFVKLFGPKPIQKYALDCNELEDARAARAAGQTLAQFRAERGVSFYEAPLTEKPADPLLPDPRNLTYLGTCTAAGGTLGAFTGTFLTCQTNGKKYFGAGITTAFGAGYAGQQVAVWGRPGATLDDVITGQSVGIEGGKDFLKGTLSGAISGNSFGYMVGAGASAGLTIPVGATFTDTVELGDGIPFKTSTEKAIGWTLTEMAQFGKPRKQISDTIAQWPESNPYGGGLYLSLMGLATDGSHNFTNPMPDKLRDAWQQSPERAEIASLITSHGGKEAITRAKKWAELVPAMKDLAMRFYQREVKDYIAK